MAGLDSAIEVGHFSAYGRDRGWSRGIVEARHTLRAEVGRIRPSILHAHYLTTAGWHGWLAGWHPFVVTVWGTDVYRNLGHLTGRIEGRLTLRAADLVTADSDDLARATVMAGARADRVRVIQFGVDTRRFAPDRDGEAVRRRLGLEARRVVFSPRTIAPLYRQLTVLEALATLPSDVVALFSAHGNREGELARLQVRAAELGLADRVRILDAIPHDAMPEYMALADVVVSIPESDATPVTLLEAMAVGRPIVASDLPSVRALVEPFDPGAIVPVGDALATGRAIAERLDWSADQRQVQATRGRAHVLESADQHASMRIVERLYAELASRRRT